MAEPVISLGTLISSMGAKNMARMLNTQAPMLRVMSMPKYTFIWLWGRNAKTVRAVPVITNTTRRYFVAEWNTLSVS